MAIGQAIKRAKFAIVMRTLIMPVAFRVLQKNIAL